MNTIPVMIRPQLIPFLFKEFEGNEASYMEKKIKSVRFLPSSSLTKYLYNQIDYSKKRGKQDEFIIQLPDIAHWAVWSLIILKLI